MTNEKNLPSLRCSTILTVALALSLGWGIRGNFGHEFGAMVPGGLAAIAVCLLSGREDWRRRVGYFGFFGALGWGFGGAISYAQVISYTHSGQPLSQLWGFGGLFVIGFLWAAIGGAGTALPAVVDRGRLTDLFKPMCWVFAVWFLMLGIEPLLEQWAPAYSETLGRQESPLYWFDADWLAALSALFAIFLFDLWETRFREWRALGTLTLFGALGGMIVQWFIQITPLVHLVQWYAYRRVGDVQFWPSERLLTNWPNLVENMPAYYTHLIGLMLGALAGIVLFFMLYGEFKRGSSLLLHMAAGWLIFFIALPVLNAGLLVGAVAGCAIYFMQHKDLKRGTTLALYMCLGALLGAILSWLPGGVRMTPPRGDDWAGILGVVVGATVYFWRNGLKPVAYASMVSGFIGGVGFSGIQCMKLVMMAPGNPACSSEASIACWSHWQSANWHSWLEQSYGFVNGLGIAIAIGLLASRLPRVSDTPPVRRGTEVFAIGFTMLILTYLNLVKNVATWLEHGDIPETMQIPLLPWPTLHAYWWFTIFYGLMIVMGFALMSIHLRRPIAMVPKTWLGKGQLFFLVFLWIMVVGNFMRALTGFQAGRILTEGTIFIVGMILTVLILLLPKEGEQVALQDPGEINWGIRMKRVFALGLCCTVLIVLAEFGVARQLYGDNPSQQGGIQYRFGDKPTWVTNPILHGGKHQ
ncbi:MAG: hypothetical protein QG656_202 [Candidatus Hydrogenedentes bacterium]|nr:hypothetical protein [Candidatus Hydrogenedentota bacterium]